MSESDFLFNESIVPIAYLDSSGNYIKVNSAYASLFCYCKEELINQNFTIHIKNPKEKEIALNEYYSFFTNTTNDSITITLENKKSLTVKIIRKLLRLDTNIQSAVFFIQNVLEEKNSNEEILNALFNAIGGVIYHVRYESNQKRKMIFISEGAEAILGIPNHKIMEDISILENHIHPEDLLSISTSIDLFKKNNNFRTIQYRVKNKTGGWKWLEERSILFESNSEDHSAYGMIMDITDQRTKNKRLEDLRYSLDQSSIVSVTDINGVIIDCNDNFCKISGYTKEEIIGNDHRLINSGYHSKQFFKNLWDKISSGKVWEGEINNTRKDGSEYWVYTYIIPLLDENGKPFRYISIRNDITPRKLAEKQLAASEEKYRMLYQNAPIGIVIVDKNGTILDTNDYLLNLMGYKRNEFVGRNYSDFLQKDFLEYKQEADHRLFDGQINRFYIEQRCITSDGHPIWLGCYSNAVKDNYGNVIYRLDFAIDIENRKKSEEELLKRDQSKNAILNIVAHDLRSPLSGITNLARLLLKQESDETRYKYLELIENAGNHSMSIIQDLLEMVKLEQDPQMIDMELTNLNTFLQDCIRMHEFQCKEKSISIKYHSSIEKVFHNINQDKMMRVISNLISNAIKFSYDNGIIEIHLYRERQSTIISIKDHGIGIPKEIQSFLFEKFSRARRIGTKGEKTIGLGLSIAKEIIDKHQGKIRIESEENKGTCVYIEL